MNNDKTAPVLLSMAEIEVAFAAIVALPQARNDPRFAAGNAALAKLQAAALTFRPKVEGSTGGTHEETAAAAAALPFPGRQG